MITINLLPKDLRRSGSSDAWKVGAIAVPVVAVIAMAGTQLYYSAQLGRAQQDVDDANTEIQLLQPQVQERNDLQQQLSTLQAVASVSDQLLTKRTSWSGDLLTFVNRLPRGSQPLVSIQTLTMRDMTAAATPPAPGATGPYDGKAVTREFALNGQATSSSALVQFLKTFEDASDFGVQFQNATRDATSGNYTFTATVGLVGSSLKPAAQSTNATSTTPAGDASGGQSAR